MRNREVQSHVAERFWAIHMCYKAPAGAAGGARCQFEWRRARVYDHVAAAVLYELCCEDPTARVLRVSPVPSVPLCTERALCADTPCKQRGARSRLCWHMQPLTCCQKPDHASTSSDLCRSLSRSLARRWTPAPVHRRARWRAGSGRAAHALAAAPAGHAGDAEAGHHAPATVGRAHHEAGRGAVPGGLHLVPAHGDRRVRPRDRPAGARPRMPRRISEARPRHALFAGVVQSVQPRSQRVGCRLHTCPVMGPCWVPLPWGCAHPMQQARRRDRRWCSSTRAMRAGARTCSASPAARCGTRRGRAATTTRRTRRYTPRATPGARPAGRRRRRDPATPREPACQFDIGGACPEACTCMAVSASMESWKAGSTARCANSGTWCDTPWLSITNSKFTD